MTYFELLFELFRFTWPLFAFMLICAGIEKLMELYRWGR